MGNANFVTFGRWPQSGAEPEPVQWLVLRREENTLLCLSRFILDYRPYHEGGGPVCWKDCSLRRWLNEDFFAAAFSAEEQARIHPARLQSPGGETEDRVFLLPPPRDMPDFSFGDPDDYYNFPPEDCAMTTPCTREKGIWFLDEEGPDQLQGLLVHPLPPVPGRR